MTKEYLIELISLTGLIGIINYLSWTKMALGSALSLLGAFFPDRQLREDKGGEGKIEVKDIKISFSGGLRFLVVFAGLVLIVGSIIEGHQESKKEEGKKFQEQVNQDANKILKEDNHGILLFENAIQSRYEKNSLWEHLQGKDKNEQYREELGKIITKGWEEKRQVLLTRMQEARNDREALEIYWEIQRFVSGVALPKLQEGVNLKYDCIKKIDENIDQYINIFHGENVCTSQTNKKMEVFEQNKNTASLKEK